MQNNYKGKKEKKPKEGVEKVDKSRVPKAWAGNLTMSKKSLTK